MKLGIAKVPGRRALVSIAVTALLSLFTAAHAADFTLRINHTMGVDSFPDKALKLFAARIEERTNGRIAVQLYSSGELGQEVEQYDLMQVGALEGALLGAQILSSVTPEYGAWEMPYLWRDQQHVRAVWDGPIGKEIADTILERKGIRIIGIYNRGARNLTTNKAVKSPTDLEGLRIRTTQNAVHVAAWKALGAIPTPMPFGEVFMGLRQGVIDGQENPVDLIASASLNEVQSYLQMTEHVRAVGWFGVSEIWFSTLPDDLKAAVLEEAKSAMASNDEALAEGESGILADLSEKMTVIKAEDLDLAAFREKVSTVPAEFASTWKPGLVEAILATGQ
jgi:tripartite ATP-independent transporter DctP family solute receptor